MSEGTRIGGGGLRGEPEAEDGAGDRRCSQDTRSWARREIEPPVEAWEPVVPQVLRGSGTCVRALDDIVQDAASSLEDLELSRLHYTYVMTDLTTFREDYRYVYRNTGRTDHRIVPLLWRWREVQANMYVLDEEDSNLVYLPSGETRRATEMYLNTLLDHGEASAKSDPDYLRSASDFARARSAISDALSFESPLEKRVEAAELVASLAEGFPAVRELALASTATSLLTQFYIPFALLTDPVASGDFGFIRHGVDLYTPSPQRSRRAWPHLQSQSIRTLDLIRLLLSGTLRVRVRLPVDILVVARAQSFHCRVIIPSGLRIVRPPDLVPNSVLGVAQNRQMSSNDDDEAYLYLPGAELKGLPSRRKIEGEIRERIEVKKAQEVRAFREKFPRLRIPKSFSEAWEAGLARRRDEARRVPVEVSLTLGVARGIAAAILMSWLVVGLAFLIALTGALDLDRFLTILGLFFVVVLTTGVYSFDKPVLRDVVTSHALSAFAVSIVLYAMQYA